MKAKAGDRITVKGITFEIQKVLSQDYFEGDGWDIELRDTTGMYRHWKQWLDGGRLISK